jgi:hypothetical protein
VPHLLYNAAMERVQPTMHEAIRDILLTKKNHTCTFVGISNENQRRDLYRRPQDGLYPNALQVRARTAKYHKLFKRLGNSEVKFIGPLPTTPAAPTAAQPNSR